MYSDNPSLDTHVITELTQAARTSVRGLEPLAAAEQHRLDANHTPCHPNPKPATCWSGSTVSRSSLCPSASSSLPPSFSDSL